MKIYLNQMPEDFILKPQREGGLHNIHGEGGSNLSRIWLRYPELMKVLQSILDGGHSTRHQLGSSFILMRKIRPQIIPSMTLDSSSLSSRFETPIPQPKAVVRKCLSELGTFGIHLAWVHPSWKSRPLSSVEMVNAKYSTFMAVIYYEPRYEWMESN